MPKTRAKAYRVSQLALQADGCLARLDTEPATGAFDPPDITVGWNARGYGVPLATPVLMIPAAIAAGLGELGRHGSLVNRSLGSSLRLAYVLTDLPLVSDRPEYFGADQFCASCHLCRTHCPPDAILDTKQMVRGELKWYVDFDKCLPHFNDTYGCAICLAVCPWSRPAVAPTLVSKMRRKLEDKGEPGGASSRPGAPKG